MGIPIAYGPKANIKSAINSGIIPPDSVIITSDDPNSAELMFYDTATNLKHIVAKTKFNSLDEAIEYAVANECAGVVITVLSGNTYKAYIIQPDGTLTPLESGSIDVGSLLSRLDNVEANSHLHSNKTLLDSITEEMIQRWNAASGTGTAGQGVLGLVQGSEEENKIAVNDDGSMSVNEINITQIVQTAGEELVLFCGAVAG